MDQSLGVLLLLAWLPTVVSQVTVSLKDTAVFVQEGEQFDISVELSGDITSTVYVIVAVKNPVDTDLDFIGSSQVGSFQPQGSKTIPLTFTVNDDGVPELEETFIFQLSVINSDVNIVEPSKAAVTIAANDDAYGYFSFLDPSPVYVTEDAVATAVNLRMGRERGTNGEITVKYVVNSSSSTAIPGLDITPQSGDILFQEGESFNYLQLKIRSDNVSENNEEFEIYLLSASQGGRVSSVPQYLVIQANDAPIRFKQSEYRVDEGMTSTQVKVTIYRGVGGDGSPLGSANSMASVDYEVVSVQAVNGLDFVAANGQVIFTADQTEATITVEILPDDIPELEEDFLLKLKSPVGDVVLSSPSETRIIINANDKQNGVLSFLSADPSTPPYIRLNEDSSQAFAVFTVVRNAGTFGNVSIPWQVVRDDLLSTPVQNSVMNTNGNLVFFQGQVQKTINISVVKDSIPEPTERLKVSLLAGDVTGGAEVEGILYGVLEIEDSDDYYGSVMFGSDFDQKIIITTNPRHLQLTLQRSGNTQGTLLCTLTVTYTDVPGSSSAVIENEEFTVEFAPGQSSRTLQIPLLASAFLQVGGQFTAVVTNIQLQTVPTLGAYNSPVLGDRTKVIVKVTINEANGEIGFSSTNPVFVDEPELIPYQVLLKLSREGTSGRAEINWTLAGGAGVTSSDTGSMAGTVTMDAGKSDAFLIFTVLPDNEPELQEEITVTLSSVAPKDTQRLKVTAKQVKVIIRENDNPGGLFQFAASMQDTYSVQEGSAAINVMVERTGGALVTRYVQYTVLPDGEAEFYGAHNVLRFNPGIYTQNTTLLAIKDGIPEKLESYTLVLQGYGNDSAGAVGSRSTIKVDILANDDPNGVIMFNDTDSYQMGESKAGDVQTVSIGVTRLQGTFGDVSVKWRVNPAANDDVLPLEGSLSFEEGQTNAVIVLESVPDEMPEDDEDFVVELWSPAGGARLGDRYTVKVIVMKNDFNVFIGDPEIWANEPSVLSLQVMRDGDASTVASVKFRTMDGTAKQAVDYEPIIEQTLVFNVGEKEKQVPVAILDDQQAETNETFYVQLYGIQGDLVFTQPPNATIHIYANDFAYGIYSFAPPLVREIEEGAKAEFRIQRQIGLFGSVEVEWEIVDNVRFRQVPVGGEFLEVNGTVVFHENDVVKSFFVTARSDGAPEESKPYVIRLVKVTVLEGMQNNDQLVKFDPLFGDIALTISANDDPYGKFGFQVTSKNLTVAEDYYTGREDLTYASFVVERRMGNFRNIKLSWELFPNQMAYNLGTVYDLILLADVPDSVNRAPHKQRKGTQTDVLYLSGAQDNFLHVTNKRYHPPRTSMASNFTISVWLQPFQNRDNFILAKTTTGGVRYFYTLRLVTGASGGANIIFGYSVTGSNTNMEQTVTTAKNLVDVKWHHIAITLKGSDLYFFLDGQRIGLKSIGLQQSLVDGDGELYVGTIAPASGDKHFIGYLQDVRVFTNALLDDAIKEIYDSPANLDIDPISGYLTFPQGENYRSITLQSVQDDLDEENEVFTIRILSVDNNATLAANDDIAMVTILKSDNANGLFGFQQPCTPSLALTENTTITCTVERQRGDNGIVNITWAVMQIFGAGSEALATGDFVDSTGVLTFYAGEKSKVFNIHVKDDTLPETKEVFQVRLTGISTTDGVVDTTNTSGASINPNAANSLINIEENDYTYGILQFSSEKIPPSPSDGVIPPATVKPLVLVSEEAGRVSLMVVRAQGSMGVVSVEWRATDETAVSPKDYIAGVGRLTFQDGQLYDFINIPIIDNSIPEDQKSFTVSLINPSGGAALSIGSQVTVTIDYSDGAFGVYQFAQASLSLQAQEIGDSGFTTVKFDVLRLQGSLGVDILFWEARGGVDNDLVETSGNVTFNRDVQTNFIEVKVRGDTVPELDETYQIHLVAADKGELGLVSMTTANLTVLANDQPYGYFVIPDSQRPIRVIEDHKNVTIVIQRLKGTYGTVEVYYRSLMFNESQSYMSGGIRRAGTTDYVPVQGSVRMLPLQTEAYFNVELLDDTEPENDEAIYVELTGILLITPAQARAVQDSPHIGILSERYAQIIINSNDNAHGVLELSPTSISVPESVRLPEVNVSRIGGAFGQITVKFRVVNGTALQHLDFEMQSDTVVLQDGERTVRVPIVIVEDPIPELMETFYIELLDQITGDAVLGTKTYSVINILPSDDPSGAFEFVLDGLSVLEPEVGGATFINISLIRTGGNVGVVSLQWNATDTSNGKVPDMDISPVSGTVFFVSNEVSRYITIAVLPDDEPEGDQKITIALTNATNGGRIGTLNTFTLTIPANDNPHGTVDFSSSQFTVDEQEASSLQYVKMTRSGGLFGLLKVYYSTEQISLYELATMSHTSVMAYFSFPQDGGMDTPGSYLDVSNEPDPTLRCASECIKLEPCLAFEVREDNGSLCIWYITEATGPLIPKTGVQYYSKNLVLTQELTMKRATAGKDFGLVTNGHVFINDNVGEGLLPLTILSDTTPELDESFRVKISLVEVVSTDTSMQYPARIGPVNSTVVTIKKNDNAFGLFTVYSDKPEATDAGQSIAVLEKPQYAVDLIVEREGGNVGPVTVDWYVETTGTTASYGMDFWADGATVQFVAGQNRRLITLTVLDDDLPELNETIQVRLRNAQGGAEIKADARVDITILENDNVAGVLGLSQTSVLAKEGDTVHINVTRSSASQGTVYIDWYIQGMGGANPASGFEVYNGSFVFAPGEISKTIDLSVIDDNLPEVNEEYQLVLNNLRTEGIGPSGAAIINPLYKMAVITIQGSNDPHGVIEISDASRDIRLLEANQAMSINIVRKFGAIGVVRVSYEIKSGSVTTLSDDLQLASPDEDFLAVQGYVDIGDGVSDAVVSVQIKDDDIPEVDEAFLVQLTGVTLLGSTESTLQPRLAAIGTVSEIIIDANDGTKGVMTFTKDSIFVAVDEITKNVSLTVFRDKGTFGDVSLFYYAESVTASANFGTDYRLTPKEMFFRKGESHKTILVEILNDEIPEPDEVFEIVLSNPSDGLLLGDPHRATVTILANDGSSGIVSFDSNTTIKVDEANGSNKVESTARLRVVRAPGIYGVVNVPFEIIPEFPENSNDLSPVQGYVTFQDLENEVYIELEALDDSEPEQTERFTIRLKGPDNSARLGMYVERMVYINPNDSPYGLINLYLRGTSQSKLSVEENVGVLYLDVIREQGADGMVTVDIATQPDTAVVNSDLNSVTLAPYQVIPATQVQGWHGYTVNNTQYLLMLTSFRVGELITSIGSNGSTVPVNVDRLFQTTLFKWRGQLVPVQTIETDVATSATSFTIDGSLFLVISNFGNIRRRKINSRVYKVNDDGSLVVLQNIQTTGAKQVKYFSHRGNHYIVFANAIDDNSQTLVDVDIFKWENSSKMFTTSPWQSLSNLGAGSVDVFEIEGVLFMAVANNYDSQRQTYVVDSIVYKLGSDDKFSEHQRIQTEGAVSVSHLAVRSLHLLVFGNNRGDVVSSPQKSWVYRWDSTSQLFFRHIDFDTDRVEKISCVMGPDDNGYMMVANGIGKSEIFAWDLQSKKFVSFWSGPPALDLYLWVISQSTGPLMMMPIAGKDPLSNATLYHLEKIKDSDFVPSIVTMTFEPGVRSLQSSVMVLQDTVPEDTEKFYITLSNPSPGADIGAHNTLTVEILSNDNAHGIIEIAPDSLEVLVQELQDRDNTIQVNIIREEGYFGQVSVNWVASGDQDGLRDITPLSGTIQFTNGQSVASITLTVLNDNIAELSEITYITLTEVVTPGTELPGKGAKIGEKNIAKIIVQANDSPYGVVLWEKGAMSIAEPNTTDVTLTVNIIRQQAALGSLQVSYQTATDTSKSADHQAISGQDYVFKQGSVIFQENATKVPVDIVIKQDDFPEGDETFLLNLTSVVLMDKIPAPGAEPSIQVPGNILAITITENDNARGIVQFNVSTNIEGRVDTYEEYGKNTTLQLRVSRTVGVLGAITITWEAVSKETTILDYYPASGTLKMEDGQQHGFIEITIVDDDIAEDMETFEVKLISESGGSMFGPNTVVRVAILKNDSPNGLFRFVQREVSVKESQNDQDPEGEVTLDIERVQGSEGVVNVRWRLSAEASNDFMEPQSGVVLFSQRETTKKITLKTKPDNVLEGREQFHVSLITADNNADISHTQGDATVVILPNPGASGTVLILPEYRTVYIGEPGESSPSYNGKVDVVLSRGLGIFGSISVTWSVTPRNSSAFMQVEGVVSFADQQQKANITLQARDDSIPELRTVYTLQITSADGGASISQTPGEFTTQVVYVASDYPHGLFEFTLPESQIVQEDILSISIPVVRNAGANSQVVVSYTTYPGSASDFEDFYPAKGTLMFQHNEKQKVIEVRVIQDDLPEGPETFYVNLTAARLLNPSNNNYTSVDGLQLDMAPDVGSVKVKVIIIDKNDDAEGTIQLQGDALEMKFEEDVGTARIPLVRTGGNYGDQTITFSVENQTAKEGIDYSVPTETVVMGDGQVQTFINITIHDDTEMEADENFIVRLESILGGAKLGSERESMIFIAQSDYPYGKFGFKGPLEIKVPNPDRILQQTLTIERTGGLVGKQTVYWRILGPNNPGSVLTETNDISFNEAGPETTSGHMTWEDGKQGNQTLTLRIKPYSSWKIEKVFIVELYKVEGDVGSNMNGEVAPGTAKVFITVSKFGDPNGIVQFKGQAASEQSVEEPEGTSSLELRFPITRRASTGTVGSIQVFWNVTGPIGKTADFQPRNGSVVIGDGQREAVITLQVLPDDIPELTETFRVHLVSVTGGGEIDPSANVSLFSIRNNDDPHGVFGVKEKDQTVAINTADLSRHVVINITRYAGLFGTVFVTFQVKYDLSQTGVLLEKNGGTVQFDEGVQRMVAKIPVIGDGFLKVGTTFTVTLTEIQFTGVAAPPRIKQEEKESKIIVPASAANSIVSLKNELESVDEDTSTCNITIFREGTYGTIDVAWISGFIDDQTPNGFVVGSITPASGTVTIAHGVPEKTFTIQLSPKTDIAELFAIHLPSAPLTNVAGGTQILANGRLTQIEPFGVVRFGANSTNPTASEMDGKVSLLVQRLYGSLGKLEVIYKSTELTAGRGLDYITMETNSLMMEPGQISGLITVQVLQDNMPEEEETFLLNLTRLEKYPTEIVPKISPRLSRLHTGSVIHIEESNDPYGVLSLEPTALEVQEEYSSVNITLRRTGGVFGTVSVVVRTVGGGEAWTSQIVPSTGEGSNDTIRQVLGNRDSLNVATGGQDYDVLDTKITLQPNQETAQILVTILADNNAEPDESVIVYLTQPTGGARVASGSPDGGKKGYSIITILQNDLSNGVIGFNVDFKSLRANEDTSSVITLKLSRTNAYYGEVEVSWTTKLSEESTEAEDAVLGQQLVRTAGTSTCPAKQASCSFTVELINDEEPEEGFSFIVKLVSVRRDAQLDPQSIVAKVDVESSDYVRGLLQFTADSRMMIVKKSSTSVRLRVERIKGQGYDITVGYQTMQLTNQLSDHGIIVNPALEDEDYKTNIGTLSFRENIQEIQTIEIVLTPLLSSSNPLPKQFYVYLKNPGNGASVNPDLSKSQASIRIVEDDNLPIWVAIGERDENKLNDSDILRTLSQLDNVAKGDMDNTEVILIENILQDIIDEGKKRPLPTDILNQIMNVLCNMMNPNKDDATRGRSSLALIMEELAYILLTGKPCPSTTPPTMSSMQCVYAKMSAARWPLNRIQSFVYSAQREDSFTVPEKIPDAPVPTETNCLDFHLMEYTSEQWFMKGDEQVLLSNKVIGFGIKNKASSYTDYSAKYTIHTPDKRLASRRAQCVYFDFAINDWVSPSGVCEVTNDLDQSGDDFVDCSCKHLTHYAVKATALDAGLVGYSEWFYVACFITVLSMALAILTHHVCSTVNAMFSANLLMHMCFACLATQLCYIVAAFLSPKEILVYNMEQNNYRCIVMGLFLHYFFLTQFTWIMAQALNYWKILVLNDEHTDRKYVLFFLIGWGSPIVILAIFYVVTFNLYKYVYYLPVDFIYGNVNNNGDMCFITNSYAALGGVILPVLIMLLVVGVVFVKAFQVTPQWQAYDDIYRGRYNINEIRTLLSFWAVIALTWLWGGLHMAYGQLWMLVLFCVFNILQGMMAIVLYTILRNPCIEQCFSPQKKQYSIGSVPAVIGQLSPEEISHNMANMEVGSMKGSRTSLLNESWERDSLPSKSTMKVKRQLPSSGNIYVTPPVLVQSSVGDNHDKDFDDLLFALKTEGGYSFSDENSIDSDKLSDISSKVDRYEMRRISIADTHL